jgi:phosphohistidine phosphatase
MAKTLFLLRHAQAQSFIDETGDFARELTHQGRAAASAVGSWLKQRKLVSPAWLVSPATRARQTAELALLASGMSSTLTLVPTIYSGNAESLLALLSQAVPQEFAQVILVGHNPTIEYLAALLMGHGDGQRSVPSFNTATLVELAYDGNWNDLAPGCATWVQSVDGRSLALT